MTTLRLISNRRAQGAAAFAEAMRELASGVALVTCEVEGRPWGMTVTAFASVSADPPTILVSLGTSSAAARAIAAGGVFGVSILAEHHVDLARHVSLPGQSKFLEPFVDERAAESRTPVVAGALAHLDCELESSLEVADHTVFFGRVRSATADAGGGAPLLYARRDYRRLARAPLEEGARWTAG